MPWVRTPDLLTVFRIPLTVLFVVWGDPVARIAIVLTAAATDVLDGIWARRLGSSRLGPVLDPVADKFFMVCAFGVVWWSGLLSPLEWLGVLLRDLTAIVAFAVTVARGRPTALPARAGGKAVTVLQGVALLAFLVATPLLRPVAWLVAAVSVFAIYDYYREAQRT